MHCRAILGTHRSQPNTIRSSVRPNATEERSGDYNLATFQIGIILISKTELLLYIYMQCYFCY